MSSIQILEFYAYTGRYFVSMELNVINLALMVIVIASVQSNVRSYFVAYTSHYTHAGFSFFTFMI